MKKLFSSALVCNETKSCIANKKSSLLRFLLLAILLTASQNVFAQGKNITGTVVDAESLQSLPGATVIVKGTAIGTSTDLDGLFSITTETDQDTLVFSYLGYEPQEVAVLGRTNISIAMNENSNALDEVVVTALGIRTEEKALGYSVQKIEGASLTIAPEANVLSNLTGKVAGLTIFNSTEFYTTPSFSLRGESPLVVIDGVPISTNLYNISPNDVEEINVLKGATASALYGSRGAGGAIMITTKKGKAGKTTVNISSSTMFNAGFIAVPDPQTVYGSGDNGRYSYVDGAGGGTNDAGTYIWGPRLDVRDSSTPSGWKEIAQWDSPIDPVTGARIPTPWVSRGKNNLRNFLRSGYIQTNNVNFSNSTDRGSYRVSATNVFQAGQVPNTKLNNVTFDLSGSTKIGAVDIESSLTYNKQASPNIPQTGYGGDNYVYNLLVWSGVDFDVRDFKDYWLVEDEQQKYYQYTPFYNNPYFLANENLNGYLEDGVYGYMTLNYEILKGLRITSRTGINTSNTIGSENTPISQSQGLGNYYEYSTNQYTVNSDLLLMYDKKITDKLSLNALAGATLNYNEYRFLSTATDGLNLPGFYSLSNSTNPVSASNYLSKKQINSAFGKLSLAYRSAIYLDVTGRNDWSSTLPVETRSYFYPSAALSTVISELVDLPEFISFAKLRGSWTISKEDLALYSLRPVYTVSPDVWGGQATASYPGAIRGANVSPEETRTYEFGADLRFLKGRVNLDVSYFNTLTYNIISNATVSNASGFTSKTTNTDERFERKGLEISLDLAPIRRKNFSWNALINWSTYNTYWDRLDPEFSPNNPYTFEGARTDNYVIYDWLRDPEGNVIHSNGFPVQDNYLTVQGNFNPDYVWSFINNFRYKDFSISMSLDGRVGGTFHSRTNQSLWNSGAHPNSVNPYREAATSGINNFVANGVVVLEGELVQDEQGGVISDTRVYGPNDTEVSYITYQKRFNPYIGNITAQNLFSETFGKLREVSVGYSLPKASCKSIGLSSLNISLIGRNLFLFNTALDFVDPDGGFDDLSSASQRNLGMNIQLSF